MLQRVARGPHWSPRSSARPRAGYARSRPRSNSPALQHAQQLCLLGGRDDSPPRRGITYPRRRARSGPMRSWRCVGKGAFARDRTSHFRTHRPATHRCSLSINERSRRPDQRHGPVLRNRLLPVPFSPVMRTGAFESATRRATARTLPASPEIRRSRRLLRRLATGRSQPPGAGCA